MKRVFWIAICVAGCLMTGMLVSAQAAPGQNTPANPAQKPAVTPPKQEANPFPEDTTNVPVMPSKDTSAVPQGTYSGGDDVDSGRLPLPGNEMDPVRSPDDATPAADSGTDQSSSSSAAGIDKVLSGLDDDTQPQGKKRKLAVKEPEHQETSAEDIEVGKYEMDRKNWKAAMSRFESAMVLAPDEPEVYWGLAESERHLGNFAEARGYYQKVAEYDPDSKHGKEAIKALKDPEIANAKVAPPAAPAK
jgi:Tetratricopeptide repeat